MRTRFVKAVLSLALMALLLAPTMGEGAATLVLRVTNAQIAKGLVDIDGAGARPASAITWEGVQVATPTGAAGKFSFTSPILPLGCVGQLSDGTSTIAVVIKYCGPPQPAANLSAPDFYSVYDGNNVRIGRVTDGSMNSVLRGAPAEVRVQVAGLTLPLYFERNKVSLFDGIAGLLCPGAGSPPPPGGVGGGGGGSGGGIAVPPPQPSPPTPGACCANPVMEFWSVDPNPPIMAGASPVRFGIQPPGQSLYRAHPTASPTSVTSYFGVTGADQEGNPVCYRDRYWDWDYDCDCMRTYPQDTLSVVPAVPLGVNLDTLFTPPFSVK